MDGRAIQLLYQKYRANRIFHVLPTIQTCLFDIQNVNGYIGNYMEMYRRMSVQAYAFRRPRYHSRPKLRKFAMPHHQHTVCKFQFTFSGALSPHISQVCYFACFANSQKFRRINGDFLLLLYLNKGLV